MSIICHHMPVAPPTPSPLKNSRNFCRHRPRPRHAVLSTVSREISKINNSTDVLKMLKFYPNLLKFKVKCVFQNFTKIYKDFGIKKLNEKQEYGRTEHDNISTIPFLLGSSSKVQNPRSSVSFQVVQFWFNVSLYLPSRK